MKPAPVPSLPARPVRRGAALSALLLATALLAGCAAISAQNPSGALRPVNAVAADGAAHLMLAGHDVVAYFTQGRHAMGSAQHRSVHQGVTFQFASAQHKALFDADPGKYIPQFGGYCTNGIAYGIPWGGDADVWRLIDGKLYIFGGTASRDAFELHLTRNMKLANDYWAAEVAGSNSFIQRSWRLIWRVPHYKSGEELAREVAAARAKKGG